MALDTTVGGPTSDSYVAVTDADTYFLNHYSLTKTSLWLGLATNQKEAVLRRGCQLIEQLRVLDTELGYGATPPQLVEQYNRVYELIIHKLQPNQALNFPRSIDVDASLAMFVPQEVKDAQCEQAVYMLAFDDAPLVTRLSGITQETVSAGPVHTQQTFGAPGTFIAPMALELLRKYLRPTRRIQRA